MRDIKYTAHASYGISCGYAEEASPSFERVISRAIENMLDKNELAFDDYYNGGVIEQFENVCVTVTAWDAVTEDVLFVRELICDLTASAVKYDVEMTDLQTKAKLRNVTASVNI